jgi:hypothetical protein
MAVESLHLAVMRRTPTQRPDIYRGPNPTYSLGETLTATALLAAAMVGAMLTVSYPVAAAAAATATVAARTAVRRLRDGRERRSSGDGRTVCVPHTDVCIET